MAYDDDLAERVRAQVASERGLDEKRMFGGLAFLVGGHMAVAVSGQGGLLLRCDPAATEELLAEDAADRFVMRGRALDGWLRVDTTGLDDAALGRWVAIGVAHARSLPPK